MKASIAVAALLLASGQALAEDVTWKCTSQHGENVDVSVRDGVMKFNGIYSDGEVFSAINLGPSALFNGQLYKDNLGYIIFLVDVSKNTIVEHRFRTNVLHLQPEARPRSGASTTEGDVTFLNPYRAFACR